MDAPQVAVQRHPVGVRGGVGHGQGNPQDGVGPQLGFVGGAVQGDQRRVHRQLLVRRPPLQLRSDGLVDEGHGLQHALAPIASRIAVAQLHRLVGAGGGARRHRRAAAAPVLQRHFHFDGGIAPGIEDLAGVNGFDIHGEFLFGACQRILLSPPFPASFYHDRAKPQSRKELRTAASPRPCGPPLSTNVARGTANCKGRGTADERRWTLITAKATARGGNCEPHPSAPAGLPPSPTRRGENRNGDSGGTADKREWTRITAKENARGGELQLPIRRFRRLRGFELRTATAATDQQ